MWPRKGRVKSEASSSALGELSRSGPWDTHWQAQGSASHRLEGAYLNQQPLKGQTDASGYFRRWNWHQLTLLLHIHLTLLVKIWLSNGPTYRKRFLWSVLSQVLSACYNCVYHYKVKDDKGSSSRNDSWVWLKQIYLSDMGPFLQADESDLGKCSVRPCLALSWRPNRSFASVHLDFSLTGASAPVLFKQL